MTSIWATVGPSLRSHAALRAAIAAGVRGLRFPASKRPLPDLGAWAAEAASAAGEEGVRLDLLLDLPGPKVQLLGDTGFSLADVSSVRIHYGPVAGPHDPVRPAVELLGAAHVAPLLVGERLLLGDGEDCLEVVASCGGHCVAVPLTGGTVGRRRGVVVRGRRMPSGPTPEDLRLLGSLAESTFTGVLVSFAESAEDVRRARAALTGIPGPGGNPLAVVAKIETARGVAAARSVAAAADGVLLGRGDLLMDVGEVEFPAACTEVLGQLAGGPTPLLVGTQLLTSAGASWLAHRSELSCVADLVARGVSGLMLSDETTVASDPQRAITLLHSLVHRYGRTSGALFPP